MTVVAIVLWLSAPGVVTAAETRRPPTYYVDKGACPFECCVYRTWEVRASTTVYVEPKARAKILGRLSAGTRVEALGGEVHTRPGRFVVGRPHATYKIRDVLWVYTYLGEGRFVVWFNGRMFEEDLQFSPYGGTSGTRCEVTEVCWGTLDRPLRWIWWAKVKVPGGPEGWVQAGENFDGTDACG
jgi:hypothetical protein